MRTKIAFICLVFCLFLGVSQCEAVTCGLVANCGFDTGSFTGWTISGNDVPGELNNLYGVEGVDPLDGIAPHSNNYQAFIGDLDSNATTLAQTLATTAGASYTISFYLAQDTAATAGYGNELIAAFGGTTLASLSGVPVEGYTAYSYIATASSSSTVLDLTLGNGLGEFLLDDVSVVRNTPSTTVTPEPPSWILMLLPMLALVLRFGRGSRLLLPLTPLQLRPQHIE